MAELGTFSVGGSPKVEYTIWADAVRNARNVTITFTIATDVGTSNASYLATGGPLIFYGGNYDGSTQASSTIKEYNTELRGTGHTNVCSFTIENTSNYTDLFFRIETGTFGAYNLYTQQVGFTLPNYNMPIAPTWVNINPNPCNINSKPVITWGGATAGSSGIIKYDVDVRSTNTNGVWSNWVNIAGGQSNSYYNEIILNKMNVYGIVPFVGVKYQYRVRVWDGYEGHSSYTYSSVLNVIFTLPTAPTSVIWSSSTVKKNQSASSSWSGATGGAGTLVSYKVVVQLTASNKTTIITSKTYENYSSSSLSISLPSVFPTATNGDFLKITVYSNNSWGQQSYASTSSYLLIKGNQIWIKVNGSWQEGECYIKVNGSWQEGLPYIKVNGSWQESI